MYSSLRYWKVGMKCMESEIKPEKGDGSEMAQGSELALETVALLTSHPL